VSSSSASTSFLARLLACAHSKTDMLAAPIWQVTEWNATRLETLALPPPDAVPAPSPTTAGLVAAASENGAYVPPMFTPGA
jgi:hypothetical protein